jgi:hypothetical protein
VQHVASEPVFDETLRYGGGLGFRAGFAVLRDPFVRTNRFLSALAASLIVFAPVHAAAQVVQQRDVSVRDRSRPEYDPLGLRLGGFTLNGSLDLGVSTTDNLFANVSGAEESDVVYSISPDARLTSNWSRHALAVYAGAGFDRHEDFGSADADTHYLRGVGRLDIGSNSSLTGAVGTAHEVESRTDPDSPVTFAPIEFDRTNASLTAQHTFNRFRVTGEVARSEYDFEGAQDYRDNEENVLRGRLEMEVTPRLGVFVEGISDERDYTNAASLSSEGQQLLAGATFNVTDLLRGEIAVGQFQRDYTNSALDSDGVAASGSLQWYATRLTTVTFDVARGSESVIGGGTGDPFVETKYGARVDHELLRNLIVSAGVRAGEREFSGGGRNDDFTSADVGADYFLNRRVALRARYRHEEVDSTGIAAFRDFEVNSLSFGLSLRL